MTQEEKFIKMTTTPVPKLVGSLAIPTIISMLVTSFYNMVDTYFVGQINTEATAAVGVVFSLMAVIQAFGFLFGHGSGTYLSRKLGEKKVDEAKEIANAGFAYAVIAGVSLMVLSLIFMNPLANILGATPTNITYVKDYMGIILIGAPFVMCSFVLNNQMRYQGNAMYSMYGIMLGAVLNIGLDPLFIFVFDMGIKGAALATIVGQIASFILLLICTRFGGNLHITLRTNPFKWSVFKEIVAAGLPSLFRQGLASLSVMLLNVSVREIAGASADAAIAGMSIVSRVSMFANSALIGFGQGFQPVCSFNYGARLYDRVKEAFYFCVKVAIGFLVVISVVGFVFAPQIVWFFRQDELVCEIGAFALRAQTLTFPLGSWIVMCNMMLQSCGKSFMASVVASCRQGACFLPLLLVLPIFFDLTGIQIAQPIADVLTLGISLPAGIYFIKEMKMLKEKEGQTND